MLLNGYGYSFRNGISIRCANNEGSKTRLKLTHTGMTSFPSDQHFSRHQFENGWKQILGTNLKDLLNATVS